MSPVSLIRRPQRRRAAAAIEHVVCCRCHTHTNKKGNINFGTCIKLHCYFALGCAFRQGRSGGKGKRTCLGAGRFNVCGAAYARFQERSRTNRRLWVSAFRRPTSLRCYSAPRLARFSASCHECTSPSAPHRLRSHRPSASATHWIDPQQQPQPRHHSSLSLHVYRPQFLALLAPLAGFSFFFFVFWFSRDGQPVPLFFCCSEIQVKALGRSSHPLSQSKAGFGARPPHPPRAALGAAPC